MIIRKTTPIETLDCKRIAALSFNFSLDQGDMTPEQFAEKHQDKSPILFDAQGGWGAFTDENELMACLDVNGYNVHFDGHTLPMAGIGGVCTYPQHRRKGAVKGMFRAFLDGLYKEQIPFSYLYPFSEGFYGNFGYHNAAGLIVWDFDLDTIPDYRFKGKFEMHMPKSPIDDYDQVYQRYSKQWNMMVMRTPEFGHSIEDSDPFKKNAYAFLYRDESGEPKGYIRFERRIDPQKGAILDCQELVYDDFETLKAIFAFIKSYRSDYQFFHMSVPEYLNIDHFCSDFSQSKSEKILKKHGMVRAVHVQGVLESARYKKDGNISLFVHDKFLPQNNGLYTVEWQNGKAVKVSFAPAPLCEFGQDCDVEVTVNVLSAAILGTYDPCDFGYMEGIVIRNADAPVDGIFYRKPCLITNFF